MDKQQGYNKKWADKNKEHKRYLSYRSTTRTFLNNYAKIEDLDEIGSLINKLKGEIKMKNIVSTLNNNYKVNGEDEKYASYYEDFKHLKDTLDIENFEEDYNTKVNELSFPIVAFDSGSSLGGYLFDTEARREDIMEVADDYFTSKNDDCVWEFEEYNVFEESDMLRFEDKDGEVLGHVILEYDEPNQSINNADKLNLGADPIVDGWEDGIGNVIGLDGWGSDE